VKILFVGVFDKQGKSTNLSQLLAFKKNGHQVIGYNYREKASLIGNKKRDEDLVSVVSERKFDLVVYSKCNVVSREVFKEIKHLTTTCLWFMDPLISYDQEMRDKTKLVDYFCCDKINVLNEALKINKNSFHVCEGYDSDVDKPHNIDKVYNVSFIGNVYGDRADILSKLKTPAKVISNAFSAKHSLEVSKSKINLNFCTSGGASDRVYKIMAAKGFLLTNDWLNREKDFIDGEHCVIFNNITDLNKKIEYYLNNPKEVERIAAAGHKKAQKFDRLSWAKKIVNLYDKIK
jgi:spore maturation protein CgeB